MLIYECLAFLLVIVEHDALQQFIGECQFSNLIFCVCAHVEEELVVCIALQLVLYALSYLLTEVCFVLHVVLTINLVEQFLVYLSLCIA